MRNKRLNKLVKNEKGQTLIIVVLLMLVSALVIAPMLSHVSSGLKSGKEVYEERMMLYYAADSGIEDGLWQIQSEKLGELFTSPAYGEYDYYETYEYPSSLYVNNKEVEVSIENIWIPKDITAPNSTEALQIINGNLVVSSGAPGLSTYQIKIAYYYDEDEDPGGAGLEIDKIGIWLPPGFEYEGNCSLESELYYTDPSNEDYCSGQAILWDFPSIPLINFPGGTTSHPLQKSFTFEFSGPENVKPGSAVSWVNTSGVDSVGYAWDADVKVYRVTSEATDVITGKHTIVEAYTSKSEIRELGASVSGDYCAVGNTLMKATGSVYYRDRLYLESSESVTNITLADIAAQGGVPPGCVPEDATMDAAYLFWSGWIEGDEDATVVWSDDCENWNNWDNGSNWSTQGWWDMEFRGRGGGSDASRTLSMYIWNNPPTYSLDLSPYAGQEVTVSWSQREEQTGWGFPTLEPGDCFKFAFSGDGGSNWSDDIVAFCDDDPSSSFDYTIPEEYITENFRMRFLVDFDESNEYVYINDINITACSASSSVEDAKVNRVVFNGHQITANINDCQTALTPDSGAPNSWCYSCFYDATDLLNQFITDEDIEPNGAGTYTLGHWTEGNDYNLYPSGSTDYPLGTPALAMQNKYQWSYAGWSLIIIYSSPDTKGHQLYLFPDLHYVAVHTTLEFAISGFLVPTQVPGEEYAAHINCFVGDGDEHYSGDYIAVRDQQGHEHKLSDGVNIGSVNTMWSHQPFSNPPNNVWNGKSIGPDGDVIEGIDVDTFQVSWSSGVLEEGDVSADIVLGNAGSSPYDAELIMLVYTIVSFRSDITSGGTLSYMVRG